MKKDEKAWHAARMGKMRNACVWTAFRPQKQSLRVRTPLCPLELISVTKSSLSNVESCSEN
jgi:hypothetical protein